MSCAPTSVGTQNNGTQCGASEYQSTLNPEAAASKSAGRQVPSDNLSVHTASASSLRKRPLSYPQDENDRIPTLTKQSSSLISTLFEKIFKGKKRKTHQMPVELENGRITHLIDTPFIHDPIDVCSNSYLIHPQEYNSTLYIPHPHAYQPHREGMFLTHDYNHPYLPNQVYNKSTQFPTQLPVLPMRHMGLEIPNPNIPEIPDQLYRDDIHKDVGEHNTELSPTILSLKKEISLVPVGTLGGLDLDNSIDALYDDSEEISVNSSDSSDSIENSHKTLHTHSSHNSHSPSIPTHQTGRSSYVSEHSNPIETPSCTARGNLSPKSQLWHWYQDFPAEEESHYSDAVSEFEAMTHIHDTNHNKNDINNNTHNSMTHTLEPNTKNSVEFSIDHEGSTNKFAEKELAFDQYYDIKTALIKNLRCVNHMDSIPNYAWHASKILTCTDSLILSAYKLIFDGIDFDNISNENLRNISKELEGLHTQYN